MSYTALGTSLVPVQSQDGSSTLYYGHGVQCLCYARRLSANPRSAYGLGQPARCGHQLDRFQVIFLALKANSANALAHNFNNVSENCMKRPSRLVRRQLHSGKGERVFCACAVVNNILDTALPHSVFTARETLSTRPAGSLEKASGFLRAIVSCGRLYPGLDPIVSTVLVE